MIFKKNQIHSCSSWETKRKHKELNSKEIILHVHKIYFFIQNSSNTIRSYYKLLLYRSYNIINYDDYGKNLPVHVLHYKSLQTISQENMLAFQLSFIIFLTFSCYYSINYPYQIRQRFWLLKFKSILLKSFIDLSVLKTQYKNYL